MFSLIITIISIALVAALALATLYYGGSAFNKGAAAADASRLINEGQQVNGAVTMAKADVGAGTLATMPTTLAALVTAGYLASVPAGMVASDLTTLTAIGETVGSDVDEAICDQIILKSNGSSVFGCTWTDPLVHADGGTFYFAL